MDSYENAKIVKERYEAELRQKANVVGVGIGLQQINGQLTDNVAIVVMVRQKLPASQLQPTDLIPSHLEGVPVDVQEVGNIRAF